MQPIECPRVEKKNIAPANPCMRAGNGIIHIGAADIGARLLMREIDACSRSIEQVQCHLIYRGSFGARIQMAEGIHMCWTVIAHQQATRLIREATFKVLDRLLVRMMLPYHRLEMTRVDKHPLIDFLTKVDQSGHNSISFINTSQYLPKRSDPHPSPKRPDQKPGKLLLSLRQAVEPGVQAESRG